MAIPRKIHRIWLGGPMPEEFVRYGERWAELHPGWEVRTWTESDLSWLRNRAEFDDANLLSSKANIARYEIVLREGGMYVDCDFEPLRSFEEVLDGADLVVGEQTPGTFNNALFAAAAGHPVLEYAVEQLPESHRARRDAISPQRTGPNFWTRCVRRRCAELGITPRVLTRDQIYPYVWTQPDLRPLGFPQAYAVHHWARSWHDQAAQRATPLRLRGLLRGMATRAKPRLEAWRSAWERLEPRTVPHRAVYVGNNRMLVNTARGFGVLSLADDLGVTPSLVIDGLYNRGFAEFIRRELGEGDVAVDVGANIGLFTLEMATAVGRTGRVFGYEPNPDVFALLQDSLYLNRMRGLGADVILRDVAVGAGSGTAVLRVPINHSGMAALTPDDAPGGVATTTHEVATVRLDEELASIAEIRLLKIDVEGGESAVLQGLRGLLKERRIRLLDLELLDLRAGPSWHPLVEELRWIDATFSPETFTIQSDGHRSPITLAEAIHSDGLQHLVLSFPCQA